MKSGANTENGELDADESDRDSDVLTEADLLGDKARKTEHFVWKFAAEHFASNYNRLYSIDHVMGPNPQPIITYYLYVSVTSHCDVTSHYGYY